MKAFLKLFRKTISTCLTSTIFFVFLFVVAIIWGISLRQSFKVARTQTAIAAKRHRPTDGPESLFKKVTDHNSATRKLDRPEQTNKVDDSKKKRSSSESAKNKDVNGRNRFDYFIPPADDVPVRRFPQAVIIGFGKCGTRAMLTFLSLHPYIVVHSPEIHFYSDNSLFVKGYKWYLSEMPFSYSNQITMEKSPDYVCSERARKEMAEHFPDIKLIVLVRNPVVRLVSAYLQRFRLTPPEERPPINVTFTKPVTKQFDPNATAVDTGIYHKHLYPWLRKFPRENIIVIADEILTADPLSVLKKTEKFLNIPPMLIEHNFYYNETSGFYCYRKYSKNDPPRCLNQFKGFKHPDLPEEEEQMLYDFYRPHNKKLFKLLNETFDWEKS
ncbi:Heparan sulfate glucosamine 3-O-sulfotransferase 6 [Bulinus truncatus]|nr:Heparan sulfate glucosamine 3-O-sulfotransferase 6 [Bulinus truncatus]